MNSVILGMANFGAVDPDGSLSVRSWRNWVLLHTEIVFTVLFTLEMLIKVSAMGLVLDKNSYLRDPWNVLDFVVVLFACVNCSYCSGFPSLPAGHLWKLSHSSLLRHDVSLMAGSFRISP